MSDQELVEGILKLLDWSDIVYVHRANMGPEAVVLNIGTFDWIINFIEKKQQDPELLTKFLNNHSHLEPEP